MDYIHMRWLVGSVGDWDALFAQAYRALRPGGWVESFETSPRLYSDDDTVPENSAMSQWSKIFFNFGNSIGRPFTVVDDDIQQNGMRSAGFVDIGVSERKVRIWTPLQVLVHPLLFLTNSFLFTARLHWALGLRT